MSVFTASYPFITAYLKGEEAKLVTSEHVGKLLKTSEIPEALEVIRDTDIGGYLGGFLIKTYDEMEERLFLYLGGSLKYLRMFTVVPEEIFRIIDAYIVKYDVLNIKAALKGISTGKKMGFIPLGTIYDLGLLPELAGASDVVALSGLLVKCGLREYGTLLKEPKAGQGAESIFEARLDGEYYHSLNSVVRKMPDGAALAKGFGILADVTNLDIIFRAVISDRTSSAAGYVIGNGYEISHEKARELLALKLKDMPDRMPYFYRKLAVEVVDSYEKSKKLTILEEIIDRHKLRLLKEMSALKLMSPLVIFWYLILKETETKNLRLIFKALFDGRPLEEIKSSLVTNA